MVQDNGQGIISAIISHNPESVLNLFNEQLDNTYDEIPILQPESGEIDVEEITMQDRIAIDTNDSQQEQPTTSQPDTDEDVTTHFTVSTRRANKLKIGDKFERQGSIEYESYDKEETIVYFREPKATDKTVRFLRAGRIEFVLKHVAYLTRSGPNQVFHQIIEYSHATCHKIKRHEEMLEDRTTRNYQIYYHNSHWIKFRNCFGHCLNQHWPPSSNQNLYSSIVKSNVIIQSSSFIIIYHPSKTHLSNCPIDSHVFSTHWMSMVFL